MSSSPRIFSNQRGLQRRFRRGAAVAEMAICLPFAILLAVGAIELSNGLFHQMAFRAAAHECATRASSGNCTSNQIQTIAQQIMSQRGVSDFNITIDEIPRTVNVGSTEQNIVTHFDIPATGTATAGLDGVPRGTILKLRILAPRPAVNGFNLISRDLEGQISAECVFVKEK